MPQIAIDLIIFIAMKRTIILLILFMTSYCARAQQLEQIKAAAELMAKAMLGNDFKTLARYTNPKVVAMMGGVDNMMAVLNKGVKEMKSRGASISDVEIGMPPSIVTSGTELYAVVPEHLIMQANGSMFSTSSSLIAMSPDKGKHWYFTDAGNMSEAQLKQLFPKVYTKLVIPKRSIPMM